MIQSSFSCVSVDPNDRTDVGLCFNKLENKVLVGFARTTLNATSSDDCLRKCLTSWVQFKFVCASASYYKGTKNENENCILNSESRFTQENKFLSQPAGENVMYYDNLCAASELPGMKQ